MSSTVDQFVLKDAQKAQVTLSNFNGKVVLIVNIATHCGKTPQLEMLETLYQRYAAQGLEILAFPCNQFAFQNLESSSKTAEFCQINYGTSFRIMEKIRVNGWWSHPLYRWLKQEKPGRIKWNFTKFLLDQHGQVVQRFGPESQLDELEAGIKALL